MKIYKSKQELSAHLRNLQQGKKRIGFVPTMGALHAGHLSLIQAARLSCDVVVCSIFVNPTQFNDPKDLDKYPRPLEADVAMLQEASCDVLFLPSVDEMYDDNETWHIELGYLERILEGKYRPGHYQGVTQIVKKLFDVVVPDRAFFGQKDFQQVMVINKLVDMFHLPVQIMVCPILREQDGLAMSSRNIHLSPAERAEALALSRALFATKQSFEFKDLKALEADAKEFLEESPGVQLEYFQICNSETLLPALSKSEEGIVALVAAKVGQTRLIDNIILK